MSQYPFRIPDSIFFALTLLVLGFTWYAVLLFYPKLPATIPVHFDIHGLADRYAVTNWQHVFRGPILQLTVVIVLALSYRWPRFHRSVSMPTVEQRRLDHLVRHLTVMNMLLLSLLMAYVIIHQLIVAVGAQSPTSRIMMGVLLGLLLALNVLYYRRIRQVVGRARSAS